MEIGDAYHQGAEINVRRQQEHPFIEDSTMFFLVPWMESSFFLSAVYLYDKERSRIIMEHELQCLLSTYTNNKQSRGMVGSVNLACVVWDWVWKYSGSILTIEPYLNAAAAPAMRIAFQALLDANEEAIPMQFRNWLEQYFIPAALGNPTQVEKDIVDLAIRLLKEKKPLLTVHKSIYILEEEKEE
jgi:hypothetical protein